MTRTDQPRKRILINILDFYLFSNLHIALCAVALCHVTRILFQFHLRDELYIFVFCGTFFLYNLQRLPAAFQKVDIARTFRRHSWNTENRKLLLGISVVAAALAGWAWLRLYHRTQLISVIPAALSVAYAFPSIYWRGKWIKLREIPGVKIFIVGLVWGMSCVWVPAAADDSYPQWTSPEVNAWMLACSLMIVAITIPFDIRDLFYDGDKLKTLPAIFGLRKVKAIGIVLMLLSVLGVGIADNISALVNHHQVIIYACWTLITCAVIAYSQPKHHEYYYSFLIDGLMILLWAMLVWL